MSNIIYLAVGYSYHQGGYNVYQVVERFLENCEKIDKTVDTFYHHLVE